MTVFWTGLAAYAFAVLLYLTMVFFATIRCGRTPRVKGLDMSVCAACDRQLCTIRVTPYLTWTGQNPPSIGPSRYRGDL